MWYIGKIAKINYICFYQKVDVIFVPGKFGLSLWLDWPMTNCRSASSESRIQDLQTFTLDALETLPFTNGKTWDYLLEYRKPHGRGQRCYSCLIFLGHLSSFRWGPWHVVRWYENSWAWPRWGLTQRIII